MEVSSQGLAFCTLGMFIIDKIEYIDAHRAAQDRIIGGAGTFAALGARLAAGSRHARAVSWIVDMGSDFPPEFQALIDAWATSCTFRLDRARLTTTAWNGYGENEYRAFKYLTPKLRLDEDSLSDEQIQARSFHMVCSPARCMSLVRGIMSRRQKLLDSSSSKNARPIFVWEPVPDLCSPEELGRLRDAARHVDVVSPNADEFASFFTSMPHCQSREAMVEALLGLRDEKPLGTALVVREGAAGCTAYVGRRTLHLMAYHQSKERVVDPTGGGNTFLGALAMGMTGSTCPGVSVFDDSRLRSESSSRFVDEKLLLGLLHATVAASYAIEQTGMPRLSVTDPDVWNGEAYQERFMQYFGRAREHILDQLAAEGAKGS